MNSQNLFSPSNLSKQRTSLDKSSSVEFQLSYDQYIMLQYCLPKKYALVEYKPGKRIQSGSNVKYAPQEGQNMSRLSGNFDNVSDNDGRSKRQKPNKKVDRFLQNEVPLKTTKRTSSERINLNLDDEMMQCFTTLQQLKKHKSAYPFLQPVDPKLDGAYNYFDIIKQPMDISTVEANLKSGQYETASQFHGDINKIWMNSYAYNEKNSALYKITIEIEKYYKNLCSNEGITKKVKVSQEKIEKPKANLKTMSLGKKDGNSSKIQEKEEQPKDQEKNSMSEERNENGFSDSDEFL